jgi:hypothetical protein
MFDLAAPVPADQHLISYIFDALPEHTHFPKLTDTDGKADCLICFCSAFPPPHNQCHTLTCIAPKRKKRGDSCRIHIDLTIDPW